VVASGGEALSQETSLPMNFSTTNFAHATPFTGKLTPPLCFLIIECYFCWVNSSNDSLKFQWFYFLGKVQKPLLWFPLSDSDKLGCVIEAFDGEERKLQFRRGMHGEIQA